MPRPAITDHRINLLSKVKVTESCWEWLASKDRGYGCFSINRKKIGAHRAAYLLLKGPIPNGRQVLHSCDNPGCVNPEHLFIGTQRDNLLDRNSKGRANLVGHKKPNASGIRNHASKFSEMDLHRIKTLLPSYSDKEIAARFKVTRAAIWNIRHGRTYKKEET